MCCRVRKRLVSVISTSSRSFQLSPTDSSTSRTDVVAMLGWAWDARGLQLCAAVRVSLNVGSGAKQGYLTEWGMVPGSGQGEARAERKREGLCVMRLAKMNVLARCKDSSPLHSGTKYLPATTRFFKTRCCMCTRSKPLWSVPLSNIVLPKGSTMLRCLCHFGDLVSM